MQMEEFHIWLGFFPSEEAINEYFTEIYSEENDDIPINKFAEDQGESFYDHDWLEYSYKDSDNLKILIEGHSYYEDYIDKIIMAARKLGISSANVFIMIDNKEITDPKSIEGDGYKLWYLGIFKCKED